VTGRTPTVSARRDSTRMPRTTVWEGGAAGLGISALVGALSVLIAIWFPFVAPVALFAGVVFSAYRAGPHGGLLALGVTAAYLFVVDVSFVSRTPWLIGHSLLSIAAIVVADRWQRSSRMLIAQATALRHAAERQAAQEVFLRHTKLELAKAEADLVVVARAKDRFLAYMSHEIRTPLNGVLGMLRVLEGTQLTEEQQHFVGGATRSGLTLMRLLNDLIDIGTDSSVHAERAGQPFDLHDVVADVAESFAALASDKSLSLSVLYAEALPRFLIGNELAVRQVLNNLMHNAIKFTTTGGVTLDIAGEYQVGSVVTVRISVSDTGCGVPHDERALLCVSRTPRTAEERAARGGGAGIGLGIVTEIVDQMRGELTVESELGRGSRFTVSLTLPVDSSVRDYSSIGAETKIQGVILIGGDATEARALSELLRFSRVWVDRCDATTDATRLLDRAAANRPYAVAVCMTEQLERVDELRVHLEGASTILMTRDVAATGSGESVGDGPANREPLPSLLERVLHQIRESAALRADVSEDEVAPTPGEAARSMSASDASMVRRDTGVALLVDDDTMNLTVLRELLRMQGVETESVSSGAEAVGKMRQAQYAAVFMDIRMPGMTGFQATDRIRDAERIACREATPIIATTANVSSVDRETYLASGMDDVLAKPIGARELAQIVQRWIKPRLTGASADRAKSDAADPELTALFLESGGQRISELRVARETGDNEQASLAAHTLKSMARHMGLSTLSEVCQAIETESHPDNPAPHINRERVEYAVRLFDEARRSLEQSADVESQAPSRASAA
jgi:signal transduction histidine kinase/CheY-like chemotaxis protein/HPt (histidine-containing phosphotransfer) domain-containing protein